MEKKRFVPTFDGLELFTTSLGEGPTVVLCDGVACDGFIWRHLRPFLAQEHRTIHWHYRGHGNSVAPEDLSTLSISSLAYDLLAVLDAYNVQEAVLISHSLGAQVTLQFALDHPERVKALIPICGSYGNPIETFHGNAILCSVFPYLNKAVSRWPGQGTRLWQTIFRSELAYQVAKRFEVNGRLLSRAAFEPYLEHLSRMDVQVVFALLEEAVHHSVEDLLDEVKVPVLVVAGAQDTFTPLWLSQRMARLLPDAELLVVPGGSHVAPLELPELVELRVRRFLHERVAPTRHSESRASAPRSKKASKGQARSP